MGWAEGVVLSGLAVVWAEGCGLTVVWAEWCGLTVVWAEGCGLKWVSMVTDWNC